MKEVVLQRVKDFILERKISKNAFAKSLNMDQTTVNNQMLGKRGISIDLILSFLENYPDISAEWLMRGVGEMYSSSKVDYTREVLSEDHNEYINVNEMRDKIISLEAENKVLREMIGLQKKAKKEKSA